MIELLEYLCAEFRNEFRKCTGIYYRLYDWQPVIEFTFYLKPGIVVHTSFSKNVYEDIRLTQENRVIDAYMLLRRMFICAMMDYFTEG